MKYIKFLSICFLFMFITFSVHADFYSLTENYKVVNNNPFSFPPHQQYVISNYDFRRYNSTQTENFVDFKDDNDLNQGSITDVSSSINGRQAGTLNGSSDVVYTTDFSFSGEVTVFTVLENNDSSIDESTMETIVSLRPKSNYRANFGAGYSGAVWSILNSNNLTTSEGNINTPHITTAIFSDTFGRIDEDDDFTYTGASGNRDLTGISIGGQSFRDYWEGKVGQVLIYDTVLSSAEIKDVKSYLEEEWFRTSTNIQVTDGLRSRWGFENFNDNYDTLIDTYDGDGSRENGTNPDHCIYKYENPKVGGIAGHYSCISDGTFVDRSNYNLSSSLTVTGWIYSPDSTTNQDWFSTISDGSITNGEGGISCKVYDGAQECLIKTSDNGHIVEESFSAKTWYHIGYVLDQSSSEMKLYVDGTLADTNTAWDGTFKEETNDIGIGQRGSHSTYWLGWLDDVRFYNKALTGSQIQTIYNNTK